VSHDSQAPRGIDTTRPSVARVYDYLIGGKDNFEVDRRAAAEATALFPGGFLGVGGIGRANRAFLGRTVRHLAEEKGIRQFLDIGIDADLRDTDTILRAAARTLDFTQPVAVLLIAILHVVEDADDPHAIVSRLLAEVPPGSHLVISHLTADVQTTAMRVLAETLTTLMAENVVLRDRDGVTRFFDGLRLVPPGVVTLDQWVPGAATPGVPGEVPVFCGVGHKPQHD
jgi:hypothetical protein